MTTLFKNAQQAKAYASYRPTYPPALLKRIVAAIDTASATTTTGERTAAADIGCGSGQVTVPLAEYFDFVTGIDPSPTQLLNATRHPRVKYLQGSIASATSKNHPGSTTTATNDNEDVDSEKNDDDVVGPNLPFANNSLSCLTVAQAAHWFDDYELFYNEVNRVLKPGGVLAIWCYGLMKFPSSPHSPPPASQPKKNDEGTSTTTMTTLEKLVVQDLYDDILGEYWDPRRLLVENLYKDLKTIDEYHPNDFTTERIVNDPTLDVIMTNENDDSTGLTPDGLIGYLRSWSGYVKYCEQHGIDTTTATTTTTTTTTTNKISSSSSSSSFKDDPMKPIEKYLKENYKSNEKIETIWPTSLLLSVKKNQQQQQQQQQS